MGVSGINNSSNGGSYYQNSVDQTITANERSNKVNTVEKNTKGKNSNENNTNKNNKDVTEKNSKSTSSDSIYRNCIMIKGLYQNVDPTGEIRRKAYLEELMRQINESISKVQSYYAKEMDDNKSFDNPYNHMLEKYNSHCYKLFGSPYFRSDLSEEERDMAFEQERAILEGRGFYNLSDPYVWAAYGGVPDREQQLNDAIQAALDQRKKELLEEYGGETTAEEYQDQMKKEFQARCSNRSQAKCMGEVKFK